MHSHMCDRKVGAVSYHAPYLPKDKKGQGGSFLADN
jgi:hypothetical protein